MPRMPSTEYCVEPRWQNFWMVLSILVLGPAAFFAGYGLGGGQFDTLSREGVVSEINAVDDSTTTPILGDQSTLAPFAPSDATGAYFLQSGEYLYSSQAGNSDSSNSRRCLEGYRENNPSATLQMCLEVQSNGNLMLYEQATTGTNAELIMLWSSQVSLEEGDYWTRLQGDGNLVTRRGAPEQDGGAVWDSKSNTVIHTDYRLALNSGATGMQIVRPTATTVTVGGVLTLPEQVLWSSVSTFFAPVTSPTSSNPPVENPVALPSSSPVEAPAPTPTVAPITPTTTTGEAPAAASIEVIPLPTPQPVSPTIQPVSPTQRPQSEALPPQTQAGWADIAWSSSESLRSGPMVGHTTHQSVQIWALQGQGKAVELVYRPRGQGSGLSINMPPNADQGAALLELSDLEPNTRYEYQIRIAGARVGEGNFKTAPTPNQPAAFQFMLASCMDIKRSQFKNQPVWSRIFEEGPDFAMLNGDTVYLNDQDWTSDGSRTILLDRVWARNLEQRDESHFKRFISNVPMYATWDDHEFGANNSDRRQSGKYNSLRAFTNIWALPSAGTPTTEGVFYSYYWGDVHFIVCDNRWYRDGSTGTQYGEAQLEWIYDQLKNSRAPFKIIVSGGDLMERGFSEDVDEIGKVVTANRISGVLFCAGDIHRNEFKARDNGNWPYKITQITSSAIAREWRRPWAMIRVDTTLPDPEIRAHFFGAENTDQDTTWGNDPEQPCSSIVGTDRYLEHRCTEVIKLSQLTA